ncbi:hypothetical protein [Salinibacterium sp. ZJ450]|uniref:hypothetical protein n=1 Tax=Salinibacterium sp. ZJ450 TaxID=2708338 RepID=UPI001420FF97|nr:hypothetical protein [Salinibacterium sp. ZJ450]
MKDDPGGEVRVSNALAPVIESFADATFPGVLWLSEAGASRAVDGWGMTCVPEDQ